mmetsp:Transcript_10456/g.19111  ORF Transcript_10456/g.19111 Transcript_10456/m.19111 type:complete len:195 (+) Transcript_10456:568-1152(+)
MSSLQLLALGSNQFHGHVMDLFSGIASNIAVLSISRNDFTGSIESFSKLKHLEYFNAAGNHLSGVLPNDADVLSHLQGLYLNYNKLEGKIPPFIGNLTYLSELGLGPNYFSGSLPSTFGRLENLEILHVQGNFLTGSIPKEYSNLSNAVAMNFGMNRELSGSVPVGMCRLATLETITVTDTEIVCDCQQKCITA